LKRAALVFLLFGLLAGGCSVKAPVTAEGSLDHQSKQEVVRLGKLFLSLSRDVDEKEARALAQDSITYSYTLSQRYELVWPPLLHNTLVNVGLKDRGLCHQWADDMLAYMTQRGYQSFDFYLGVSNMGNLREHNTLVVSAKGTGFDQGVVLDPWRDSGVLFFIKIEEDDEYRWNHRDGG
jgi:hypothetical protein